MSTETSNLDEAGTTEQVDSIPPVQSNSSDSCVIQRDGDSHLERGLAHQRQLDAIDVFGSAAKDGSVYRWGVAVATGMPCDELVEILSRVACGAKVSKKQRSGLDWDRCAGEWCERIDGSQPLHPADAALAVVWSAALPNLVDQLGSDRWHQLLSSLLGLHESVRQQNDPSAPMQLLLGGEMGLTLALGLPEIPSCARLLESSLAAIQSWCNTESESISRALTSGVNARLILASLIRCKRMISAAGIKPFDKASWKETGDLFATWVAAMTTYGGRSAFSHASKASVKDDCRPDGLLEHATKFDAETLKSAVAAALGSSPSGGRLAWQVSLPEAMHHDPDAKFAVMFPEWDVRRGRMHIDYSTSQAIVELFAGRSAILSGPCETSIETNGKRQRPLDTWQEVCEYSDDDVHYLEIEQNWTGGVLLQRQFMLIRDDRCVLFADAVLPSSDHGNDDKSATDPAGLGEIRYSCRMPLAESVGAESELDTSELMLSSGRRGVLVLPLSANEWRVGATACTVSTTEDRHLAVTAKGHNRLYTPVWFDVQQRRFKRQRTWRPLTIADQLRVVGSDEAVAYRIQMGAEQWMVYRSLAEHRSRTVLGKHLIADFFCSRFDSGDGGHEELITVDDSESMDHE